MQNLNQNLFRVGDVYIIKVWNGDRYVDKEYTVIKTTGEKVTLRSGKDRAVTRKPRKIRNRSGTDGCSWALGITDGQHGTVYKSDIGKEQEDREGVSE